MSSTSSNEGRNVNQQTSDDTPLGRAWEKLQNLREGLREEYESNHAVADRVGTNPILEVKRSISDSLDTMGEKVDEKEDKLKEADVDVLATFDGLVTEVKTFFEQPGDPAWLRATAASWQEEISKPVLLRVKWFTENGMTTDNSWTGPAADAYRAYLPSQEAGMKAINQSASEVASWLEKVATKIESFWFGLGVAFSNGAANAIALLVSLGGVNTVINPGEKIAQLIRDLATLVRDAVQEFENSFVDLKDIATTMEKQYLTVSAFPMRRDGAERRSWPVIGGGDLSTDKADWTPRR